MNRRRFLAATAGAGTVLFAGCTGNGGSDGNGDSSPSGDGGTAMGTFRLLISDQPADIGDFDSLDVTLSKARVFRAADDEEDDDSDDGDGTETPEGTETAEPTETEEPTETPEGTEPEEEEDDEDDEEDGEDDGEGGFTELDLDGETVDLTQVVGEKAISVLEGELEAGTYTKIELHASDVVGVVDGDEVDVKLPSEKLQITKTFEVEEGEEVSFVFDIHVVKRGPNNGYILRPVISESGVAGEDVEVEEVEDEEDDESDDEGGESDDEGTETTEPTETPEATDTPESAGNESA